MTKLAEQRAGLPDQPGVYLFHDARGRVIYVGKAKSIRKRVASHFSGARHAGRVHRPHRVPRRRDRGRGAAGGAELHPPVQAALQHPAARRQVVSVHRDLARRGLPAGLLHARAPPQGARLLRPVLVGQARARHARPARQDLPVPLLRGAGAGAALGLAVPRLLHQALRGALRRLRVQGGVPPGHRRRDRVPVRAASARSSASSRTACSSPPASRTSSRRRSSATGCRPCARCSSASASPTTAPAPTTRSRSRSTPPTPTRRSSRSATACCRTARASTSTTRASTTSRARARSSCSSTTRARCRSRR